MAWWWLLVMALQVQASDPCGGLLADLDRERAAAFATADPARLDRVYTTTSEARDRDAAVIAQYRDRGGTVIGALPVVAECSVVRRTGTTIELDVVDALGPAHVRWDDGSTARLPTDRPTRRILTLEATADGWRVSGSRSPASR